MNKINQGWLLILILVFAFFTRVWRVSIPSDYYFDEVYHAFTAKAYAQNDPRGYEWWHQAPEGVAYEWLHPPISKLLMGGSIYLLGENSFAWRFPSVLAGVLVIAATYKLAEIVTKKKEVALLAAVISSWDGLLLTQSRIAMNDIFVTFFYLAALYSYFQYWRIGRKKNDDKKRGWIKAVEVGIWAGLALSTKWSGVFVLGVIGVWEIFESMKRFKGVVEWGLHWLSLSLLLLAGWWFYLGLYSVNTMLAVVMVVVTGLLVIGVAGLTVGRSRLLMGVLCFGMIPALVYLASFGQFWLQPRKDNVDTFINLHKQIWWYQTNLEATHPYQSKPWQWLLNTKPVWFYVDWRQDTTANIYALANPAISWLGLIAVISFAGYDMWNRKPEGIFVMLSYVWVWLPWVISPRIMFFYHYTPAIPLLAIGIAWLVWQLWGLRGKTFKVMAGLILVGIGSLFVYFYPFWTGLPIPKQYVDQYYWFESWH